MKRVNLLSMVLAGSLFATASLAQAPAGAPAASTGLCNDGTYSSAPTRKGACRGHQGVKEWYSTAAAAAARPAAAPPPRAQPAAASRPAAFNPPAVAAPGGGSDKVWVNKSSRVYHCADDRWYGKTRNGAYMSEAEATAGGFKPDHGKTCRRN